MRRALLSALALVGVSSMSLATLTLSGDYLELNIGSEGILIGDGAAGSGAVGMRYDDTGSGSFGGFNDVNDWGYPSYARTIVAGADSATHYSGGFFGSLAPLSGPTVTDTSFGTTLQAVVTTVYSGLVHVRTYTFDQGATAVRINDSYTNISNGALALAAIDSFDPDQGIPHGFGFGTNNDVVAPNQVDAEAAGVTVSMWSTDGLGAGNVVSYGLESYNPFDAIFDPNGANGDLGISMQYDFGMVDPYACVKTEFYVGFDGTPVPDPATLATLGLGLAGLAARRRKKA